MDALSEATKDKHIDLLLEGQANLTEVLKRHQR